MKSSSLSLVGRVGLENHARARKVILSPRIRSSNYLKRDRVCMPIAYAQARDTTWEHRLKDDWFVVGVKGRKPVAVVLPPPSSLSSRRGRGAVTSVLQPTPSRSCTMVFQTRKVCRGHMTGSASELQLHGGRKDRKKSGSPCTWSPWVLPRALETQALFVIQETASSKRVRCHVLT